MYPKITRIQPDSDINKLLLETSTNKIKLGFSLIGPDNLCMPSIYERYAEEIENFEVFDDDIWVISHPKCGTTWTQEMVWLLCNNLNFEGAKTSLIQRFPFMEISGIFDYTNVRKEEPNIKLPRDICESISIAKCQPRPRFIKSHLPWSVLPKNLREGINKPKIVYVARNPKDTCSSYFYHYQILEGFNGTYDQFAELFLAGKVMFGPYWSSIRGFWERRNEPNILFIKYEDMKRDLASVIRQTAKFLEKEILEEDINKLVPFLSFEEMKKRVGVSTNFNRQFFTNNATGDFFRSGKVGSYKNEMSAELEAKFDEFSEEFRRETGFAF